MFPFLRTLGGDDSPYAHQMRDARFTIPTAGLLAKVVDLLDILLSLVWAFGKVLVAPDGIEPGIINPRLLKIAPVNVASVQQMICRFRAAATGLDALFASLQYRAFRGEL